MKKLMIAAAIVCAATLSHGAALYWNWQVAGAVSTLMDTTPATVANTTVYLFADYTSADNMKAAADGILSTLRANEGDVSKLSGMKDTGALGSTGLMAAAKQISSEAFTTAQNNYMFTVVVAEDANGQKWAAISNINKKGLGTGGQATNIDMSNWDGEYVYAGLDKKFVDEGKGWYQLTTSGGVPEPTSGLLLLLGVAGLALRRRRA